MDDSNSHPCGALAPSPAWAHFPGTGKGSSSWGLRLPLLDLTHRSPLMSSVPGPALKVPRGEAIEGGLGTAVPCSLAKRPPCPVTLPLG